MAIRDARAFIASTTRYLPVPHTPEISLYVADEATELWEKTEEELGEIGLPPPFWAFAWAGGQALARYVLDNPDIVAGKIVLDFAAGSGLVAIAAARAGALKVTASEIDAFAIAAIELNAVANGQVLSTHLGDLVGEDRSWDVVLAADIFYQKDIAERVAAWLAALEARGAKVLIGDPGRSYLPRERLVKICDYAIPVTRALEDSEIKRTSVWRFRRAEES